MFTDLVMSTKNDKIFQQSIQLAICLLEGGNTEIQVTDGPISMYSHALRERQKNNQGVKPILKQSAVHV